MKSVSEMLDARLREDIARERVELFRGAVAGLIIGAVIAMPLGYVGVKLIASAAATAVQVERFPGLDRQK